MQPTPFSPRDSVPEVRPAAPDGKVELMRVVTDRPWTANVLRTHTTHTASSSLWAALDDFDAVVDAKPAGLRVTMLAADGGMTVRAAAT